MGFEGETLYSQIGISDQIEGSVLDSRCQRGRGPFFRHFWKFLTNEDPQRRAHYLTDSSWMQLAQMPSASFWFP